MAIVKCYECEREVSDSAASCPHCGAPFAKSQPQVIPKRRGLSTGAIIAIVLTSVFIGGGVILFSVLFIFASYDRSCQTTTIENVMRMGMGVEQYKMDYQHAPFARDIHELQDIFEETEINLNQSMVKDGWGNDLIYEHSGVGIYTVMSYGSDNAVGPVVTPNLTGDLIVRHFDEDIIWSMGRFVQRPEGAQTSGRW